MKTLLVLLLSLSASAFAQTKPAELPKLPDAVAAKPAAPKPVHAVSDKQRGDFFRAQYNVSQNELAIAKARIEADEKLLSAPAASARDQAGQSIVQTCADAKVDSAGDITCPEPKPEAPKPEASKTDAPKPELKPAK